MKANLVFIGSRVTPETKAAIERLVRETEWPESQLIRKLIEESPRIKAALKNGQKK